MISLGLGEDPILRRCVDLIRGNLDESRRVMAEAAVLRQAFEAVQQRRDLTKRLDQLVAQVEATRLVRTITLLNRISSGSCYLLNQIAYSAELPQENFRISLGCYEGFFMKGKFLP